MDAKELRELAERLRNAAANAEETTDAEDDTQCTFLPFTLWSMKAMLKEAADTADRLAAVEYRLQCANLYGHQCDADISELIKRAEKAEADLAALRARVEAAPVGETECCDAKGAWLVMADDAKLANGQRVRLLSDPQPEGR